MSYLNNVRLVFSGTFQADVSTVNNDVRHYDNKSFEPSFQKLQDADSLNGWWNPTGSGAFRLIGCRVVAVHYGDGTGTTSSADDPAVGCLVGGPDDHTSGKIVDIDPQWQLASALWGMQVRLVRGDGSGLFGGAYRPHAFRDLWFGRMLGPSGQPGGGDAFASATFQSVLDEVEWAADLAGSRFLAELKAASAATGQLSIRLATFGFSDSPPTGREFTIGTVTGAIGPQLPGEPESFVFGRRFTPANGATTNVGCSYFTGRVDRDKRMLFLDLGNALQLAFANRDSTQGPVMLATDVAPIGDPANSTLRAGILRDPSVAEFTPAGDDNFLPIGTIPYLAKGWLLSTSGIAAFPLTDEQLALAADHPLALAVQTDLNAGTGENGRYGQIAIRESADGLFVGAEPIVHRIDAPGRCKTTVHAARYGAPLADAKVRISQLGSMPGQGGGSPNDSNPPTAPIPPIGVPESALQIPASLTTGAEGCATLPIGGTDPGAVRGYIDGQLYLIDFRLPGQGNQARSGFDYVVVHVRNAYPVPDDPSWEEHVRPIMTQYANLYPVMSKRLIDLSDPEALKANAALLRLAFDQPIGSANYMPVTRDLSEGKRLTILKWLDKVASRGDPTLDAAIRPPGPPAGRRPKTEPSAVQREGGKTAAARSFARAGGRRVV
ncbi:MAG TPA: hypothetical protein VF601_11165 [Beijerinckiaceae bacterium]